MERHDRVIDDGFGMQVEKCDRKDCGLEIVRPGQTQCYCEDEQEFDGVEAVDEEVEGSTH